MSRLYKTHRDYIHFHEVPAPQQNNRAYNMGFNETPNAPPPSAYEIANAPNEKTDAAESLAVASTTTMGEPSSVDGDKINNRCEGNTQLYMDVYEMPPCEGAPSTSKPLALPNMPMSSRPSTWRKRSVSFYDGSGSDDYGGDDVRKSRPMPGKKHNHSEVEKRRRDKMNTYISELSCMIPMCGAMSRKLDKLTVLRMAVQHLRSVRGSISACRLGAQPRPAHLPETERNDLVLDAARKCFILVVGCDRGRLIYVSESVSQTLSYDKSELLGQSLFDILHPKDVAKVKEQLSSSDLSPRERLIDAKTMLPLRREVCAGASRFCTGARRSFYCRIKCKVEPEQSTSAAPAAPVDVKEEGFERPHTSAGLSAAPQPAKKYCAVLCTGYLKSGTSEVREGEGCDDGDYSTSCLVAVGRALPDLAPMPVSTNSAPATRLVQFVSRHATDGKFLFVDQRVTPALGYLPQELLGTSLYEYVAAPEVGAVALAHKEALLHRNPLHTSPYYFRRKNGSHARLQTHFKPFRNPWTKDVDYLVANNTVLSDTQQPQPSPSYDMYKQKADAHVQYLIDPQVETHKIVSTIAEEVLQPPSPDFPLDLPTDLLQDPFFTQQPSLVDSILNEPGLELVEEARGEARGEASGSGGGGDEGGAGAGSSLSGGGEVALAVIMSLLEADAGLGGPINLSTFP